MSMGGQTVTFVTFTQGATPDRLGIKPEVAVEESVSGCLFRPLSAAETAQTEIDIATQVWRCTADPQPAVLAADSTGYLKWDGQTFNIIGGAQPHYDFAGRVDNVTVLAQKQEG